MNVVRPEYLPAPDLETEAMESLQRSIASDATFEDRLEFDPGSMDGVLDTTESTEPPVVLGVDQAFLDDRAISAVVALQNGEVVERVTAVEPLELPYVPGLLAFREGPPIISALRQLSVDPDLLVVDGSGRIHYRQAGLATHLGVLFDLPSVGIAKSLLCGHPENSTEDLEEGTRVPILADEKVETVGPNPAKRDTAIGYAVQTRQYDSPNRHVNPVYVSPGHRVSASTAANLVLRLSAGYKLPEPTRLADAYADVVKAEVRS